MWRVLYALMLTIGAVGGTQLVAAAQGSDESVPPVTAPMTLSEMLRQAGHRIANEEAAYLDADAELTDQFVRPVLTVDLFAASVVDDRSRELVLTALRQIVAMDPSARRVAPPPTLQELDRLALARRTAAQQAARRWIEGLEANDPAWLARGTEALGAANRAEAEWYVALQQYLSGAQAGRP
jgi:hypothetical protein